MAKTYRNLRAASCQLCHIDGTGNKIPGTATERVVLYNTDHVSEEQLRQMIICGEAESSPDILVVDRDKAARLADARLWE
jgi:hypothetical protein